MSPLLPQTSTLLGNLRIENYNEQRMQVWKWHYHTEMATAPITVRKTGAESESAAHECPPDLGIPKKSQPLAHDQVLPVLPNRLSFNDSLWPKTNSEAFHSEPVQRILIGCPSSVSHKPVSSSRAGLCLQTWRSSPAIDRCSITWFSTQAVSRDSNFTRIYAQSELSLRFTALSTITGQMVNILGFAGQSPSQILNSAINYINEWEWLCSNRILFVGTVLKFEFDIIFTCLKKLLKKFFFNDLRTLKTILSSHTI